MVVDQGILTTHCGRYFSFHLMCYKTNVEEIIKTVMHARRNSSTPNKSLINIVSKAHSDGAQMNEIERRENHLFKTL